MLKRGGGYHLSWEPTIVALWLGSVSPLRSLLAHFYNKLMLCQELHQISHIATHAHEHHLFLLHGKYKTVCKLLWDRVEGWFWGFSGSHFSSYTLWISPPVILVRDFQTFFKSQSFHSKSISTEIPEKPNY